MVTNPEEIHGQLHHHWVKGIVRHYDDKDIPKWDIFFEEYKCVMGPKLKEHKLPSNYS